ncbi:MAG TPA: hypothetical protein VE196_07325 [Pseudonocardiaceae bacterium]|jgi:hypothetical protein|nr:hypothetical protein [Pseudonocardiaceae bacterium]
MLMATLLARMPDLRCRAQILHVPDEHRYCSECGNQVCWPCQIYQIAAEAESLESSHGHRNHAPPTVEAGQGRHAL